MSLEWECADCTEMGSDACLVHGEKAKPLSHKNRVRLERQFNMVGVSRLCREIERLEVQLERVRDGMFCTPCNAKEDGYAGRCACCGEEF